jgi:RNA-binding protein
LWFPYTSFDFNEVTMLDARTKKYLRGQAHSLASVVAVGKEGVTDAVAAEIERTAESVELVKIRLLPNAPLDRKAAEQALVGRLRGEFVGGIGRVLIYFLPVSSTSGGRDRNE